MDVRNFTNAAIDLGRLLIEERRVPERKDLRGELSDRGPDSFGGAAVGGRGDSGIGGRSAPNAVATGGIVDLPPVTVPAERVSGQHKHVYADFLFSFQPPLAPPYDPNVDSIDPDGDIGILSPEILLRAYPEFNRLPQKLQELVLASPVATSQMLSFLSAGGRFEFVDGLGVAGGEYVSGVPPVIRLDRESVQVAMNGDNVDYDNGLLIATLGHELGHWTVDSGGGYGAFQGSTFEDYLDYVALGEALAIINEMIIVGEVEFAGEQATMIGYATESVLAPLYSKFQDDGDLDSLTQSLIDIVKENQVWVDNIREHWDEHEDQIVN